MNTLFAWSQRNPTITLMLILMFFDTLLGVLRAWQEQKLSSEISGKGMRRKATMISMVAVAGACERYLGGGPYAAITAAGFAFTELLSIVENAGLLGVTLPPVFHQVLAQLKPASEKALGSVRHADVVDQALDAVIGEDGSRDG